MIIAKSKMAFLSDLIESFVPTLAFADNEVSNWTVDGGFSPEINRIKVLTE